MRNEKIGNGLLRTATRGFPTTDGKSKKAKGKRGKNEPKWPRHAIVFDTETTTDATQRLLFGCYRTLELRGDEYVCITEGLFYADDLATTRPDEYAVLRAYCDNSDDLAPLISQREFIKERFYRIAYNLKGLVVGFNLPFDLSRLACKSSRARAPFKGGFSLTLDDNGEGENLDNPRICIDHVNSKRARIRFAGTMPRQSKEGPSFRGHFLDLRTGAFALSDKPYTLAKAAEAFNLPVTKGEPEQHGIITPEYIDYNRRDVHASQELLNALKHEFDRYPIDLHPTQAHSPASIAKSHLRAMGLTPPLSRSVVGEEYLGHAISAYYGGRSECHIRKTVVPVVYCDFLSMYPTVNTLMGMWPLLTAERIEVVEAIAEVQQLLDEINANDCFDPSTWPDLRFFAELTPDSDILPVRAQYDPLLTGYNIGVNPFTSVAPAWYAGPDLIAAKVLGGKTPKIRRAFRVVGHGTQAGLQPIDLRGKVRIDPANEDFFKAVIEARKRTEADTEIPEAEQKRLSPFLKVIANSGSYGILAEMNRQEQDEMKRMTVYGAGDPFTVKGTPEEPGDFCFPPFAALITASARLMLALLEHAITELGGSYGFCDTDSMAIVATERGGLVPCEGGNHTIDGQEMIQALSWPQVHQIASRFESLKPYDAASVPGSVLEIEKQNYDKNGIQQPLYCYSISAKRYALFTLEPITDRPVLQKSSEHGLGHLLSPIEATNNENRDWTKDVWQYIVSEALGHDVEAPHWLDRPALGRQTISSPAIEQLFAELNSECSYPEKIKPFGFMLNAYVSPLDVPEGIDPTQFQLVAPYNTNPATWEGSTWTNRYDGTTHVISSTWGQYSPSIVQVKTHRDVLNEYRHHPESKSLGPDGQPAHQQTVGLLQRRHIYELERRTIGKEANRLEEREANLIHDQDEVLNDFTTPDKNEFALHVLPIIKTKRAADLAKQIGVSESYVHRVLKSDVQPSKKLENKLTEAAAHAIRHLYPASELADNELCALHSYLSERIPTL
jgi:hypothetical protein